MILPGFIDTSAIVRGVWSTSGPRYFTPHYPFERRLDRPQSREYIYLISVSSSRLISLFLFFPFFPSFIFVPFVRSSSRLLLF